MRDYSELKLLAEAAPEGPWFGPEYAPGTSYVFDVDLGTLLHYESIDSEKDACLRYVAAANPAAVLALIADIEQSERGNVILGDHLAKVVAERDQLKAENEALRKDAERYQFLKNLPDDQYLIERLECATDPENWDAAIDRAMSKEG